MMTKLKHLSQKSIIQGVPFHATFELTPRCNMYCNMCYINRPEFIGDSFSLRPYSFWLSMAEQAKANGTLVIVITGGETFLYPNVEELLEKLLEMGFIISLNTNGTLLDEQRIGWLNVHRPAKINISLYGASDETYKRLCGIDHGYTLVSSAIDKLLLNGHNVYLNTPITKENVADIPDMVAFAKSRGLVVHGTSYLFPPGRYGCYENASRLSPKEAAYAELLLEYLQEGQDSQIEKCKQRFSLVDAARKGQVPLQGGFHSGDGCSRSNCGGGRNSFAISWNGKMMPCVTNSGVEIPLDDRSFEQAWCDLRKAMAELVLPKECKQCPIQVLCNACTAMIYNESGNFNQLSEYTCSFMRENYLARVELLKRYKRINNESI